MATTQELLDIETSITNLTAIKGGLQQQIDAATALLEQACEDLAQAEIDRDECLEVIFGGTGPLFAATKEEPEKVFKEVRAKNDFQTAITVCNLLDGRSIE